MRIVYDSFADAAHIYLRELALGEVVNTEPCDVDIQEGAVILEFDGKGFVVGIEILSASRLLPPELLETAVKRGS